MPTITSISQATQDRILSAIDTTQATAVRATEVVSGAVTKVVPDKVLAVGALPEKAGMPSPGQAVDLTWGFAQELVSRQKAFAEKLVAATPSPSSPEA